MVETGGLLDRSAAQQLKFLAKKDAMMHLFSKEDRFHTQFDKYGGIVLSPRFAFLHIFKCGGTTLESMGAKSMRLPVLEEVETIKLWVTVVRDPIDHFLSGWGECGDRGQIDNPVPLNKPYDVRIRAWLEEVRSKRTATLTCSMHSNPQVSYMVNREGEFHPKLAAVGDLSEFKDFSIHIGHFDKWQDGVIGRDSTTNEVKKNDYPKHRELLSDTTLLELCEFLKLDYYLLDFEPPAICTKEGGPLYGIV